LWVAGHVISIGCVERAICLPIVPPLRNQTDIPVSAWSTEDLSNETEDINEKW